MAQAVEYLPTKNKALFQYFYCEEDCDFSLIIQMLFCIYVQVICHLQTHQILGII
jgi:hypothetical protein